MTRSFADTGEPTGVAPATLGDLVAGLRSMPAPAPGMVRVVIADDRAPMVARHLDDLRVAMAAAGIALLTPGEAAARGVGLASKAAADALRREGVVVGELPVAVLAARVATIPRPCVAPAPVAAGPSAKTLRRRERLAARAARQRGGA